jgi:hypothetical protein
MITVGKKFDKQIFSKLYELLKTMFVHFRTGQSSRYGFPKHRAMVFGLTRERYTGVFGLSVNSIRYEKVFEEILKIADEIGLKDTDFTSIYLNHNVTCPKHTDRNNKGLSTVISFGDYDGGNLVINDEIYDAKYTPITFDGSKIEHYNTDDLIGNKYSLVFFSI